MRLLVILGLRRPGGLQQRPVTVPQDSVITEVPQAGSASTTAAATASPRTIESALDENGQPRGAGRASRRRRPGAALDDDRINLMQWTLEQQKIDAAIAERELAAAREQLVVVQPGPLPNRVDGRQHRALRQADDQRRRRATLRPLGRARGWPASATAAASATPTRRSGRSWPAAVRSATATASIRTATASPAAGTRRPTARCN